MKKLKCIIEVPEEKYTVTDVTVGKTYEQDNDYPDIDDYCIIDDTGQKRYYDKCFFKEIKNE
jgi:hypothetical protein